MTEQPPITPSDEQVQQWVNLLPQGSVKAFTAAAQWGADQELEACCEWVAVESIAAATELRAARRFKQPSLKEEALTALTRYATGETILTNNSVDIIRRALEQLDD